MITIGTKVRILVNYLSELSPDTDPIWEGTISEILDNEPYGLNYCIKELNMYFSKDELEVIGQ